MTATTCLAALDIRRVIDATPAEAWIAWTDPDMVARWFAPGAMRAEVLALEVRVGGRYRIRMHGADGGTHTVGGCYTAVDRPRRLAMTWAWEGSDGPESRVTVRFTPSGRGTEIEIVHEGLPDPASADEHRKGWNGCLDKLNQRLAEGGTR